jgi:uncharacterized membrane protein
MKFISSRIHGLMDYALGVVLIISPWLFGFGQAGWESWIPIALGIILILYSAMTDYEYSLTRQISMKTHLVLDGVSGVFLAVSPWLFNFSEVVFLPHLILGILEIGAALATHTVSETEHRHEHKHSHAH